MKKNKISILKLLEEGKTVQIKPQGYSMYPMFVPGRDSAVIVKARTQELKRGDVVLYRRDEGTIVLHRIWKVRKEGVYLIGDNQSLIEGPLRLEQIKGVLAAFIRKGKTISTDNLFYRIISAVWLALLPFRDGIKRTVLRLNKILYF